MVEIIQSKRIQTHIDFPSSSKGDRGKRPKEKRDTAIVEQYVPQFEDHGYKTCYLCFLAGMSAMFVIILLVFGGMVFMFIEYDNYAERQALQISTETRISEYHVQYNVSNEYLHLLTQRATLANIRKENKWDVVSASYFSITIVSTIGFGWWAPLTDGGKIFMIIYAFLGIPIFLYASFQYVAVLMVLLRPRVNYFCSKLNIRTSDVGPLITIWISTLIIASITFYIIEDWNFLDATYFCIETGTTIALGDLEPIKEWNAFTALVNFHCFLTFIGATLMLLMESTSATGEISLVITKKFFPKEENRKTIIRASEVPNLKYKKERNEVELR